MFRELLLKVAGFSEVTAYLPLILVGMEDVEHLGKLGHFYSDALLWS